MNKQKAIGLPLPRWCFIILAIPTFYMPLSYIVLFVWALAVMFGDMFNPPGWIESALYVTYAMCPVYLAWVCFSKMLTLREKGYWALIVIFLNMIGMPMFYIFMIRRYLGLEGQIRKRDEIKLDSFLTTCGLNRSSLSTEQIDILKSYCRKQRYAKYGLLPMIFISCLTFYTAFVFVPRSCIELFSNYTPTELVITDSIKGTKKEITPDPETKELRVQNIMMMGAMAGMLGTMGFFCLIMTISMGWTNWHRKAFIEYLKAKRE